MIFTMVYPPRDIQRYEMDSVTQNCADSQTKHLTMVITVYTQDVYIQGFAYLHTCVSFTHLDLVSHICGVTNSSHFPSDAYLRRKSLYLSYNIKETKGIIA